MDVYDPTRFPAVPDAAPYATRTAPTGPTASGVITVVAAVLGIPVPVIAFAVAWESVSWFNTGPSDYVAQFVWFLVGAISGALGVLLAVTALIRGGGVGVVAGAVLTICCGSIAVLACGLFAFTSSSVL